MYASRAFLHASNAALASAASGAFTRFLIDCSTSRSSRSRSAYSGWSLMRLSPVNDGNLLILHEGRAGFILANRLAVLKSRVGRFAGRVRTTSFSSAKPAQQQWDRADQHDDEVCGQSLKQMRRFSSADGGGICKVNPYEFMKSEGSSHTEPPEPSEAS